MSFLEYMMHHRKFLIDVFFRIYDASSNIIFSSWSYYPKLDGFMPTFKKVSKPAILDLNYYHLTSGQFLLMLAHCSFRLSFLFVFPLLSLIKFFRECVGLWRASCKLVFCLCIFWLC